MNCRACDDTDETDVWACSSFVGPVDGRHGRLKDATSKALSGWDIRSWIGRITLSCVKSPARLQESRVFYSQAKCPVHSFSKPPQTQGRKSVRNTSSIRGGRCILKQSRHQRELKERLVENAKYRTHDVRRAKGNIERDRSCSRNQKFPCLISTVAQLPYGAADKAETL